MTSSGVYLAALRWIFCEFPLKKNVLLQVSTSSLDQYLSGLITQFTSMINLDLVVGSLDFISDITSVCWSIFLHLLHFKRANDKEVLPTVCSAKTQLTEFTLWRGQGVLPGSFASRSELLWRLRSCFFLKCTWKYCQTSWLSAALHLPQDLRWLSFCFSWPMIIPCIDSGLRNQGNWSIFLCLKAFLVAEGLAL